MQKKVPQVKEGREVLEKLPELNKENGKGDTKLRNFAARLNTLDRAVQLQQDAGYLVTAQLGAIQRRAAVDAKDEEAAKSGLAKLYELIELRRCPEVESGQARCVEH